MPKILSHRIRRNSGVSGLSLLFCTCTGLLNISKSISFYLEKSIDDPQIQCIPMVFPIFWTLFYFILGGWFFFFFNFSLFSAISIQRNLEHLIFAIISKALWEGGMLLVAYEKKRKFTFNA